MQSKEREIELSALLQKFMDDELDFENIVPMITYSMKEGIEHVTKVLTINSA